MGVLTGENCTISGYGPPDATITTQQDSFLDEFRQIIYDSLKETPQPMKRDPHEGTGHYRPAFRERRERDFGKKQRRLDEIVPLDGQMTMEDL